MESAPVDRRLSDTPLGDATRIVAILYIVGYIGMVGALLFLEIPDNNKEIVIALVAIMSTVQTGIISYYFGSSRNAEVAQKATIIARERSDDAIQSIAKTVSAAPPTNGVH